ncbi:MAG: hypothetical protein WCW35_15630, partial [Bacteroidota bacterium]
MQTKFLHIVFSFVILTSLLQSQWTRNYSLYYETLDAGNITLYLNNIGNLNSGMGGSRFHVPNSLLTYVVFDHGLTIIGKMNDTLRALVNHWYSPFSPGPIIDGLPAIQSPMRDTLRYKLYKISRSDTVESNPDFKNWPADLGAPDDTAGRPILYGDQTVWSIYNAADSGSAPYVMRYDKNRSTLPLEIHQSTYSYKTPPLFYPSFINDAVFLEWVIINKGTSAIDSCFIGFWTDIDFNNYDNPPAIDTALQFGYSYTPLDTFHRKDIPLTVGYTFLYGPQVSAAGEQAIFGNRIVMNKKNLPMTSFWGIGDDSYGDGSYYGHPYSVGTLWNVARGLYPDGKPIIDTLENIVTRFPYSGDPVTQKGWLFPKNRLSGGAGFEFFSGPLTIAPNDTQWMMIALIANVGTDAKESIQQLRLKAQFLREMSVNEIRGRGFDWSDSVETKKPVPSFYELHQNYPNP